MDCKIIYVVYSKFICYVPLLSTTADRPENKGSYLVLPATSHQVVSPVLAAFHHYSSTHLQNCNNLVLSLSLSFFLSLPVSLSLSLSLYISESLQYVVSYRRTLPLDIQVVCYFRICKSFNVVQMLKLQVQFCTS